ncbi:MAG: hypothetical protein PHY47_00505 [Lachnospiraceae bacterium]|nr:hypothetical protein [Lachnospiraceae bacterium]
MAKIENGGVIDLILLSQAEGKIGDYKYSHLTPETFADEHLGKWMLCNGQSCVGTMFHVLTGSTTVPNALTNGAFIRQAKTDRSIGTYESEDFKSHTHIQNAHNHVDGFAGVNDHSSFGATTTAVAGNINSQNGISVNFHALTSSVTATNQNTGGIETRPNNIALNLYVKVGY